MRIALLFLLVTAFVLVRANDPVLVCRNDKSDGCDCNKEDYDNNYKVLNIRCTKNAQINTTNIIVPDSLMNKVEIVKILFSEIGLTQITKPLLSSQLSAIVAYLTIADHKINKIEANVFDNLSNLISLEIDNVTNGNLLDNKWLTPKLGKSLHYLTLKGNKITKIPTRFFNNLASLEEVYIQNNQVEEIADFAFDNLPALTTLNLNSNKIQLIPSKAFGNVPKLSELSLCDNQISEVGKFALRKLERLETLNLTSNNIQTIPDSNVFAKENDLSTLILNDNKIKQITEQNFYGYDGLIDLQIARNQIEKIPKGVFDRMKKIHKLTLSLNRIEKIEDGALDNLALLEVLNLNGNKKLSLNDGTFGPNGLTNLGMLDFSECNLKILSSNVFKNLPQLFSLDLSHNNFTEVPAAIRNVKLLDILDLSFNDISSLQANAFGTLPLQYLYLNSMSKGKLMVIQDCAFCGLTNLKLVYLNNNDDLKQINENAFGFAKNSVDRTLELNLLQVHDGGLKIVPKKLFPWDKIHISILGNPANCDSNMDWLFRNKDYHIDQNPTPRYFDKKWCEQCKHDRVCQKLYGWKDPTTQSPMLNDF